MRLNTLFRRLRAMTAAELRTLLIPRKIDVLLYEAPQDTVEVLHTMPHSISIHRYSSETLPVGMSILKLTRDRLLYIVTDDEDGTIVHWNALLFDARLPACFGYDSAVPVIGHGHTEERYRGHRIQPHTLSYIVKDLRQSNPASTVYTLVSPENTAGVAGVERAGFRAVARLRGWRCAGLFFRKAQSPVDS